MTTARDPKAFPSLAERIMASPNADSNLGLATILFSVLSLLLILIQWVGSPGEFVGLLLLVMAILSATGWYLLATIDYIRGHIGAFRVFLVFSILCIGGFGLALSFIADAARAA